METGADAVRIPGWLRSRSRGAAWHAGDPSAPVADEVLIVRIADGDAGALAALYQRYGGKLFGFLRRYASDRMVAEEILQDTLLAVWRSVQLYAGRSSVRTWLFGVAWRQAHNRLRGRQPQEVPLDSLTGWVDPAPGPAELADFSAQGAAIADAFEALTLRHREVLALAFAAMMPHREIAEILGVPLGTVKSRLHHARAALARTLAERIIISAKMNTDDNSCPSCGSGLVTERDAAPWCPACEWNLALFEPKRHALFGWHRLDRAVDQFAHRVTRGQFKALAGRPVGRSGWDAAQIVTVSISLLLYAAVAAMAAGGVVLIASDFPSLTIVPGVALVLLAVALRPRFGRLDPDATTISPQQAPTLFRLIDRWLRRSERPARTRLFSMSGSMPGRAPSGCAGGASSAWGFRSGVCFRPSSASPCWVMSWGTSSTVTSGVTCSSSPHTPRLAGCPSCFAQAGADRGQTGRSWAS
jgi:RNA polymerase sigma factor (sigma-70 family)